MRISLLLLTAGLALALSACEEENATGVDDNLLVLSMQRATPVLIVAERELERFPRDPFRILSLAIEEDVMFLRVRYRGCMPHPFHLVARERFQFPPRLDVPPFFQPPHLTLTVSHDARGDLCPDFFHEELRFDLRPVREHFRTTFGFESGEMVLVIAGARVLYHF